MREFWSCLPAEVPLRTGAVNADGVSDIREVLAALELDLAGKRVLDVGCGTGRLAELCGEYVGCDLSPSMVEYAACQGLDVYLVDGPAGIRPCSVDVVACLSVFTHIGRDDRRAYLDVFWQAAPQLLVDILPGAEGGDYAAWYADTAEFESDLRDAGYEWFESFDRVSGDGHLHRYFLAR